MLVELKRMWFAPVDTGLRPDKRSISGVRFRKGIQEIPDNLKDVLPPDAVIVKSRVEEAVEEAVKDLKHYDNARIDADHQAAVEQGAETARQEMIKRNRDAALARGRAKAKANREAKKAAEKKD